MDTILLIEDNPEVRENTAEILELAGYDVRTAAEGKTGVRMARDYQPALIICDIMMPELDGFGVIRMLQQQEATASIPFIFLTARAERDDLRKGMTLGADDYLTKPFDDHELLDAVEVRLRKSRLKQQEFTPSLEGLHQLIDEAASFRDLRDLSRQHRPRAYAKKRPVFLVGSAAQYLYFVHEGRIKTYKTSEDGREYVTGMWGPGEFFGYQALFENANHPESAVALENSELVLLPKQDVLALSYRNHDVAMKFIKLLSHNLIEREEQLLRMAYHSVRQRTAKALLTLAEQPGHEEGFRVTREDLAGMVGTAKETVIRTLSEFKDEALVATEGRTVRVLNTDKLAQVVRRNFVW
ncbi:MAG: response regulator [Catalinimonas sp.]